MGEGLIRMQTGRQWVKKTSLLTLVVVAQARQVGNKLKRMRQVDFKF
jgi:hypothetical protein